MAWVGKHIPWWRHHTKYSSCGPISYDDAMMTPIIRKRLPRYWSFVRGNHRSPANSPHKGPVTRSFVVFFDLCMNKWLSKPSRRRWFQTPSRSLWRHCNADKIWSVITVTLKRTLNISYFSYHDEDLPIKVNRIYWNRSIKMSRWHILYCNIWTSLLGHLRPNNIWNTMKWGCIIGRTHNTHYRYL